MSTDTPQHQAAANTDRELWREREGDYYADSIHVTERGGIGINCGGIVFVKPVREWHRLARLAESEKQPIQTTGPAVRSEVSQGESRLHHPAPEREGEIAARESLEPQGRMAVPSETYGEPRGRAERLDGGERPASSSDDKLGGPVVWACRTKSDGSYSDSVVPVRWTMAEDKLAAMRADPWVQKGLAEIVPLYESPPSATDATARDAARYQFWRKNTAITVPSMTEQLIDEGLDAAMAAVDSSGERNG